MRNRKQLFVVAALGALTMMGACKKGDQGSTGPTGPAGPAYTGAISGHVMLYDQYGTKLTEDLSGVKVTLTSDSGTTTSTVTTDGNGYYIFPGVRTGAYSMMVTDPNTSPYTFGANVATSFQFLEDTLNKDIKLSAIPTFSPATMSAYMTSYTQNDSLVFTIAPDTRARDIIVFVNSNSTVNNVPGNYLLAYVKGVNANATTFSLLVPANDLMDQGISAGSTVYFAAYGYPVSDYSVYEDLATGTNVYNALSTSYLAANAIAP